VCFFMSDFWWKRLRQNGQANGRMLSWISRCVVNVDDLLNRFSQTPHLNGLAVAPDSASAVPKLCCDHVDQLYVTGSPQGRRRPASALSSTNFSAGALRSSLGLSAFLSTTSKNGFQIFVLDRCCPWLFAQDVELLCCIFSFSIHQKYVED